MGGATAVARDETGRLRGVRPKATTDLARRAEAEMLYLVIMHPPILPAVAEQLGALSFEPEAEALRRTVMDHLGRPLDELSALRERPDAASYFRRMAPVLSPHHYTLGRADDEELKQVWLRIWQSCHLRQELESDRARTEAELGSDPRPENFERLIALQEAGWELDREEG